MGCCMVWQRGRREEGGRRRRKGGGGRGKGDRRMMMMIRYITNRGKNKKINIPKNSKTDINE